MNNYQKQIAESEKRLNRYIKLAKILILIIATCSLVSLVLLLVDMIPK